VRSTKLSAREERVVKWKGFAPYNNKVEIYGLSNEPIRMERKKNDTWEKRVHLFPGIHAYWINAQRSWKHEPSEPFVVLKYWQHHPLNVICIGEGFSIEMANSLYNLLDLLVEKDCHQEIELFLKKYNCQIDSKFYYMGYHNFFEYRGYGTLLHWACFFKKPDVVFTLISRNASLSSTFEQEFTYGGREYKKV